MCCKLLLFAVVVVDATATIQDIFERLSIDYRLRAVLTTSICNWLPFIPRINTDPFPAPATFNELVIYCCTTELIGRLE